MSIENTSQEHQANRTRMLPVYALFLLFHFLSSILVASAEPFPNALDELAHYSYIRHTNDTRALFTDYSNSYLLSETDLSNWSENKNYLSHPSFYYLSLALLFNINGDDPTTEITLLRLINIIISTVAVVLLFIAGFRILKTPVAHLVYAAVITLFPKISVVGGMINNDNLALLGAALAFLGLVNATQRHIRISTALLIGSGFALAALAKLTAGLGIGVLVLFFHLIKYRQVLRLDRDHLPYLVILFIFILIGMAPYLVNLVNLGNPIYVNADMLLTSSGKRLILDFPGYVSHFFGLLAKKWAAYEPSNVLQMTAPAGVLGLFVLGLVHGARNPRTEPGANVIVVSAAGTLCCVMLIHIVFLYNLHLDTGHLSGASSRYYLPIWPGIALGAAMGAAALPDGRPRAYLLIALIALLLSCTAPFAIGWHAIHQV